MSLTATDLQDIRTIIREEVPEIVHKEVSVQLGPVNGHLRDIDERLTSVEGRLEGVENDVKDIYFMITELQAPASA